MSGLSEEQLDKVELEFLRRKVERMHSEIEGWMDKVTELQGRLTGATQTLNVTLFDEKGLTEKLAELEHEQWTEWSNAIAPELDKIGNGWKRHQRWVKLWIPFAELSEEAKEADRKWARKVMVIVNQELEKMRSALNGEDTK